MHLRFGIANAFGSGGCASMVRPFLCSVQTKVVRCVELHDVKVRR